MYFGMELFIWNMLPETVHPLALHVIAILLIIFLVLLHAAGEYMYQQLKI